MRTNRSINNLRQDIRHFLTQLKFSTLQQELEKQYDQPNMETLSFERRLADALRNVCEKRSELNYEKVMDQAYVSPDVRQADFENFWSTQARKLFSSLIEQLQTCEWLIKEKPANLVIVGPSGAGKSWLASAFSRQACRLNLRVRFVGNTKQFLDELNTHKSEGSSSRYLSKLKVDRIENIVTTAFTADIYLGFFGRIFGISWRTFIWKKWNYAMYYF